MFLCTLKLNNFRNHLHFEADIPECLYISGDNGTGKTSVIEAAYLITTAKTFRAQPNIIKNFDAAHFRVEARFNENSIYDSAVFFYDKQRKFLINGAEGEVKTFIRALPVICYSPDYETILSDDQQERRNFLDRMIYYTDKTYIADVQKYTQLLKRKRAELLNNTPNKNLLLILTEELANISCVITEKRQNIINSVNNIISETKDLFFEDYKLVISDSDITVNGIDEEIDAGKVLAGAHRQLIYLKSGKNNIEKFQSFGQKKCIHLSLLHYFSKYLHANTKENVLFLLDDFEAGIDKNRLNILYGKFLNNKNKCQILLTGLVNNTGLAEINLNKVQNA